VQFPTWAVFSLHLTPVGKCFNCTGLVNLVVCFIRVNKLSTQLHMGVKVGVSTFDKTGNSVLTCVTSGAEGLY
jgi:hypothetical protein